MKSVISTLILLILSVCAYSQTIIVKDDITLLPIQDVYIYDIEGTSSTNTNKSGEFDINVFQKSEFVTLQHPAYFNLTLPYNDLIKMKEVLLSEHIIKMDELVVSANKWEQSTADIPSSIVAINSREIAFQNPQTSADLLESSGKVFIQKSQMGGGSPMIRGFSANSILIVIDGVRMNNAIFRSGNLQNIMSIDPFMLESAEVIFGPGSVLYGSDALGGVMDFHTINPSFTEMPKTEASVLGRYSGANNEKTSIAKISYSKSRFSLFAGFSFSSYSDLRTGSNRPSNHPDFGKRKFYQTRENGVDVFKLNDNENIQRTSAYNQWNGIGKLRYKLSDKSEITYGGYFSNTTNIPRYDRLILMDGENPKSAEWNYGPQRWSRHSLRFQSFNPVNLYSGIKMTFGYQTFEESRITRDFGSDLRLNRKEEVSVVSFNIDLDKEINSNNNIYYGAELILNGVQSNGISENIASHEISKAQSRYPDGGSSYNTFAAYVTYNNKLSEKFTLSGGGRLSNVSLTSTFVDKSLFDFPFNEVKLINTAVNGNLGIVFKPSSKWKLDYILSTGFRAPNVDDVGKLFDSEPGNLIVPNPDLKPEKVLNMDVGFSKSFNHNFKIDVTTFYSWVNDLIARRDFTFNGADSIIYDGVKSKVQALKNVENGLIYGLSIYAKGEISSTLAITSSYTITAGQDNDGFPIRHAAPNFGKTSIIWQKKKFHTEIYANYNAKLEWDKLAPSEQKKPHLYSSEGALSWLTFNLKCSIIINEYFKLNTGVENIFDIHYRPYSSGISAPGRNFILSAKLNI